MEKQFINGFDSWIETYHEITSAIALELTKNTIDSKVISERYESQGSGGMYELAEELTDKFEKLHEHRIWDGDWRDTIDYYIQKELA